MQDISDSFFLNGKFSLKAISPSICDIKCLPGERFVVATHLKSNTGVMICSESGKPENVAYLNERALELVLVDKITVAVLLFRSCLYVAMVDIQQKHVHYISNENIQVNEHSSFIYSDNRIHISDKLGINVIDMSGTLERRIELSFTPHYMCYDVVSQRIYCIDSYNSKLVCIDTDGNNIFTIAEHNMTNLKSLTIDNVGNVLVLRIDDGSGCVFKVNANGKLSEVVITNIKMPIHNSCICFSRFTNSVVIGVDKTVYIYVRKY